MLSSNDPEVEAAWEQEILARIQAIDDGTAAGVCYEEVHARGSGSSCTMKITFLEEANLEFLSNCDFSSQERRGQARLPDLRASLTRTLHFDLESLSTKLKAIN
jgi:Putative addiction module component